MIPKCINLLLNLSLFIACTRRAGHRFKQIVRCKLMIALVKYSFPARAYPADNGFQIVINGSLAETLEKIMCLNMGFKKHLLRLPRESNDKGHSAVTETHMGNLYCYWYPAQHYGFRAPVELKGFSLLENKRHIC